MPGRLWTNEEDAILKARYETEGASRALQEVLGRTQQSLVHRAMYLGLSKNASLPWSDEEDTILRAEYPKGCHSELAARLHRSECAINIRASRIGVRVSHDAFVRNVSKGKGVGAANARFKGSGRVSGMFMAALRERQNCTVTPAYLDSLAVDRCPFSNRGLVYRTHRGIKGTASLDRIDPTKGYIEGNVRWIHKWVNMMKWDMSDDEFLYWVFLISRHCGGGLTPIDGPLGVQPDYVVPKHGGNGFRGHGRVTGTYLGKILRGAQSRKLDHPLFLDSDGLRYLDSIIPAVCPFSGEELTFPSSSQQRFTTASLDRIDPTRGYHQDNVRWIHRVVNLMKIDFTDVEFLTLINEIAEHSL